MRFFSRRQWKFSAWEWAAIVAGLLGISALLLARHRRHRRKIYLGGAVMGLVLAGVITTTSNQGTDILAIPSEYDNSVQAAFSQQQLYSALWYPMRVCYGEAPCSSIDANIPVGWPNSTTDSDTIRNSGARTVIWG